MNSAATKSLKHALLKFFSLSSVVFDDPVK